MKTSCLISNYNYAQYVGEAIDGALRQTVPFDQIVVVDDGSSDGSVELLTSKYGCNPAVQIVCKSNEGQLSCFNEGFARATGDLVFFLDADDIYEPDYVEQALDVFKREASCDFLMCGRRTFGGQNRTVLQYPEDRDLGYSLIQTALARSWIGGATSCLSMRRPLLEKILPLPFVEEWRVRADDCLVFGSSLAGARKRYLAQPLVRYRVHGKNHYCDRATNHAEIYRRRVAVNRLFEHFERALCYNTERLADIAHREFLTLERPSLRQLMVYARISMGARLGLFQRLGYVAETMGHFLNTMRKGAAHESSKSSSVAEQPAILPLPFVERQGTIDAREATHATVQGRRAA